MYLAMFVRTEPELFNDLLRLRVGLIIQIMAGELARALRCKGNELLFCFAFLHLSFMVHVGPDASEYLLNLSPYEIKTLLHHILSGKEIDIREEVGGVNEDAIRVAPLLRRERRSGIARLRKSIQVSFPERVQFFVCMSLMLQSPQNLVRGISRNASSDGPLNELNARIGAGDYLLPVGNGELAEQTMSGDFPEKTGRWLRRRRLDGALNRLPQDFYPRIWHLLEKVTKKILKNLLVFKVSVLSVSRDLCC